MIALDEDTRVFSLFVYSIGPYVIFAHIVLLQCCNVYYTLPLATAHANQALELSKMQERTEQLKHMETMKVCEFCN